MDIAWQISAKKNITVKKIQQNIIKSLKIPIVNINDGFFDHLSLCLNLSVFNIKVITFSLKA